MQSENANGRAKKRKADGAIKNERSDAPADADDAGAEPRPLAVVRVEEGGAPKVARVSAVREAYAKKVDALRRADEARRNAENAAVARRQRAIDELCACLDDKPGAIEHIEKTLIAMALENIPVDLNAGNANAHLITKPWLVYSCWHSDDGSGPVGRIVGPQHVHMFVDATGRLLMLPLPQAPDIQYPALFFYFKHLLPKMTMPAGLVLALSDKRAGSTIALEITASEVPVPP